MLAQQSTKGIGKVIFSSSLGTLIEWYDFYIFGMLAKTISVQFFPETNTTAALLSTLAIFAAGFFSKAIWCISIWPAWRCNWQKIYFFINPCINGWLHIFNRLNT